MNATPLAPCWSAPVPRRLWSLAVWSAILVASCDRASVAPLPPLEIPAQIVGASMAPTLWGVYREACCEVCSRTWRMDDKRPRSGEIFCPQCGQRIAWTQTTLHTPPRYQVQPWAQTLSPSDIPRWTVVAFRRVTPESPQSTYVKRIVGLPGETVSIVNGEIFVNDRLVSKDWGEITQFRRLVFDSRCNQRFQSNTRSSSPTSPSIATDGDSTPDGGWILPTPNTANSRSTTNWGYRHRAVYLNPQSVHPSANPNPLASTPIDHPSTAVMPEDGDPICDYDPENPTAVRRLNKVTDLIYVWDLTANEDSDWTWSFDYHGREYHVTVRRDAGNFFLSCKQAGASVPLFDTVWKANAPKNSEQWELATVDGLLRVRHQGVERARISMEVSAASPTVSESAFGPRGVHGCELSVRQGPIELHRFQLFRDVYWLPGPPRTENSPSETPNQIPLPPGLTTGEAKPHLWRIPADSYFVLGDNPPISQDSRQWDPWPVKAQDLLGYVRIEETDR